MNSKVLRTVLLVGSILSTLVLWLTRHEWQNSLSAFASSQNAVWYNLMHVMGILFWALNSAGKSRYMKHSPFIPKYWKKKKVFYLKGIKWRYKPLKYYELLKIRHGDLDIIVAMGMGAILVTNMYLAYTWHVVVTIATLVLAIFNIIFTSPKRDIVFRFILGAGAVAAFIVGYWTDFHFLVGEVLAMSLIAFGMIRQIWKYD